MQKHAPSVTDPRSMPASAGIGLRAEHHAAVLATSPAVGWLEVHSENYFAPAGTAHSALDAIRADYPLSLHGVGLSLGATDPLDREHLAHLKLAIRRYEPVLVSEHLCWGMAGGRHTNDLLPLPYTREALRHLVSRIACAQEALGRRLLIENVSSYLTFRDSQMTEWDFLAALARETGGGILLDINNIYVGARNHGFDALDYLAALPRNAVEEIHLAGHSTRMLDGHQLLVDTHNARVCDDVWALYAAAVARFGRVPTLIEWDIDLPALEVLVDEAHHADRIAGESHALAA
ncbi:MAG: DUF692 domain-containing protein [Pseudomonadota bacterium]